MRDLLRRVEDLERGQQGPFSRLVMLGPDESVEQAKERLGIPADVMTLAISDSAS